MLLSTRSITIADARFKVDVVIAPGTHESEAAVNKQLADKEREAAALKNPNLLEVVNQCLATKNSNSMDEVSCKNAVQN